MRMLRQLSTVVAKVPQPSPVVFRLTDGRLLANRNPRSAEVLGAQPKRLGFATDPKLSKSFYNRLRLQFTNEHTYAIVDHWKGGVIASANTTEAAVATQLYSCTDKSAARSIGVLVASRLQSMGIERVHWDIGSRRYHGRVKEFIDAVKSSGISLKE